MKLNTNGQHVSGAVLPSSGAAIPFTPSRYGESGPVYYLREPHYRVVSRLDARLGQVVGLLSQADLRGQLREAIRRCAIDEEAAEEAIAEIDDLEEMEASDEPDETALAALVAAVTETEGIVRQADAGYREVLVRRSEAIGDVNMTATRVALLSWDAINPNWPECQIGPDGLATEASMEVIPADDVTAIAQRFFELRRPSADQVGNSNAPSSSRKGRNGSRAAGRRQTARPGKSEASSTPKIHA